MNNHKEIKNHIIELNKRCLNKIENDTEDIQKRTEEIKASFQNIVSKEKLFTRKYSKPILIAFLVAFFNQTTSLNEVKEMYRRKYLEEPVKSRQLIKNILESQPKTHRKELMQLAIEMQ